jgi:hypothetical protein
MTQLNNKQRRHVRRRNYLSRELHEPKFRQRIVEEKRKHKLDVIHEQEAEEDLDEYLAQFGVAPKE